MTWSPRRLCPWASFNYPIATKNSIKNCKIHHFADDTNLMLTNSSLKKIKRQLNHDFSLICHWLRANKISLNTSKTEIIIYRPSKKQITKHLSLRISGQKSTPAVMLNILARYNVRRKFWMESSTQFTQIKIKWSYWPSPIAMCQNFYWKHYNRSFFLPI